MLPTSKYFQVNPDLFDPFYHYTELDTVNRNDILHLKCLENELNGAILKIEMDMEITKWDVVNTERERGEIYDKWKAADLQLKKIQAKFEAGLALGDNETLRKITIQLDEISAIFQRKLALEEPERTMSSLKLQLQRKNRELARTKSALQAAEIKLEQQKERADRRNLAQLATQPSPSDIMSSFKQLSL